MFPKLQNHKIDQVQKIINGGKSKSKPHINITTKSPSCKQIIVPMNKEAANMYIKNVSSHINNINHTLKFIKLNILADFICIDDKGIIISTNNVASPSDLQEIKKYIKNSLLNNGDQVFFPWLPQSKSYLKIVGIPFLNKQSNICISPEDMEKILKNNHIFNNIVLTSKPRVIKVSPKSDMAIIWIDIWDTQNGSKAKTIINWWFNMGSFITMVHGANMNLDIPQCKNYWK